MLKNRRSERATASAGSGGSVASFALRATATGFVGAFGRGYRFLWRRRNGGVGLRTGMRPDRYGRFPRGDSGQSLTEIAVTIGVVLVIVMAFAGGYTLWRNRGGTDQSAARALPRATPVSDAQFATFAQTAASRSVLKLSDLPAGWASKPHSASPDSKLALPARCQLLNEDNLPNAVVNKDGDDFDSGAVLVSSGVSVYRNADLAANTAQLYFAVESDCKDALAAAMRTDLADTMSGVDTSVVETQSSVPSAKVFRITATGQIRGRPAIIRLDQGFVLSGRIVSGVITSVANNDPAAPKIDDLLLLLLKRASDADAMLPR